MPALIFVDEDRKQEKKKDIRDYFISWKNEGFESFCKTEWFANEMLMKLKGKAHN